MLLRALVVSLLCHLALFSRWSVAEREVLSTGTSSANLRAVLVSGAGREVANSGRPERSPQRLAGGGNRAAQKNPALSDGKVAARSRSRETASSTDGASGGRPAASLPAAPLGGGLAAPDDERRAPSVSAETPSPDLVRQYRLALAREARRHKRYPALARSRGWEGLVTVGIQVPLPGATPQLSIEGSCGVDYLDGLALEMITLSVRSVDLPEGLKGRAFSIQVPVRYALDE